MGVWGNKNLKSYKTIFSWISILKLDFHTATATATTTTTTNLI